MWTILDNWAVFDELLDDILEGKVDSEIQGQVMRVQTQKQSFNFFFWNNWELFWCMQLQRSLNYKIFSTLQGMGDEVCFHVFEKEDPKLPRKTKLSSHYEEEKAPVEFISKVKEHYHDFFIKQLK